MDSQLRKRLADQMSRGDVILFTGAGFSMSALALNGQNVPSVNKLRELIWPLAFPNEQLDSDSNLGDIYEVAAKRAGNRLGILLKEYFSINHSKLPDVYKIWFSMPWYRIYTLNIDNLDEAVQSNFVFQRRIQSISALQEHLPTNIEQLQSIHLNGRAIDFPLVTFSPRQYAERAGKQDPWHAHLVADLVSHPVLYVGTTLNEPLFWQHIEMRRGKERGTKEFRPGSYLVTKGIPVARREMLKEFNIQLIEMYQEDFAIEILKSMETEKLHGFSMLSTRQQLTMTSKGIQRITDLRRTTSDDPGEFLLGREPHWSDILSGIAITRDFEENFEKEVEQNNHKIILITGTAGSGKSTTLMKQALRLQAEGKEVGWLNFQAGYSINDYRQLARNSDLDILVIDDVDHFGRNTGNFLVELISDNPKLIVIATIRSTRFEKYQIQDYLIGNNQFVFSVPGLEDSDINLLLQALTNANRLGKLKGLPHQKQVEIFREKAGRQLLVAMIEATSHERFDEKIDKECKDLEGETGIIYATVALATSLRQYLTKDEILLAIGNAVNESLNKIHSLIKQKLLIEKNGFQIQLRHRVVADRAIDYYRKEGQLREPIIGLLWTMSTKVKPENNKNSRESQLLIKLLNHKFMRNLTSDKDTPRLAYAQVEGLLDWSYHYYLQRGSYEVEIGDLDLAKNFLEQAKAMAPDDYKVQTEWAYMTIKRAAQNAISVNANQQVEEAFCELEDAIEHRGRIDPYPYHVYGSQGLAWSRRAIISDDEKNRLLSRLLFTVQKGIKHHPNQTDLNQLSEDIKRELLMMTVLKS